MLGAWVRLSDAGLGCPDWPGCYGHLDVPATADEVAIANSAFPDRPLQAHKAWKEMVHRYAAGGLGLLVLALVCVAWRRRYQAGQPFAIVLLLAAVIVFQAMLGMWTVTLQLKPVVVVAHLLGGFTTLALLCWLTMQRAPALVSGPQRRSGPGLRLWAGAALVAVLVQVALGGWTSANYAALACTEFPTCHGQWWPEADFAEAFVLWRGVGQNYEFGVLDSSARTAIHMTHRLGALLVLGIVGGLAVRLLGARRGRHRVLGRALLFLLPVQIVLGVSNVLLALPLPVAVAHNGVAALLLLAVVSVNCQLWQSTGGRIPGEIR